LSAAHFPSSKSLPVPRKLIMVYQPKDPITLLDGAYPLEVSKTFVHLNIKEEIEPLQIQRGSTAPAKVSESEDSDEECEDETLVRLPKLLGSLATMAEDEGAPEPNALCRTTTYDAWEAQVPPGPGMLERTSTYDVFEEGGAQSEQGNWESTHRVGEVMQPVMASGTELSHAVLPINLVPVTMWSPGIFGAFQPVALAGSPDFSPSLAQPAGFALSPAEVLPPNDNVDTSSDEHFWALPLSPQPQKLFKTYIVSSGIDRAYWTVEAGKLKSNSRVSVSPALTVSCPGTAEKLELKMVIHPSSGSFKSSGGKGFVQIKCESNPDLYQSTKFTFRIGISSGRGDHKWQEMRGPFKWNFQENVICGLSEDKREWNFTEVVDEKSNTFAICLEIIPQF